MKFNCNKAELKFIVEIAERTRRIVIATGKTPPEKETIAMALSACHSNGTHLDLEKLSLIEDHNLIHDVYGILEHLNHKTGKLIKSHCFKPFCAINPTSKAKPLPKIDG